MTAPREIELKLVLEPGDVGAIRRRIATVAVGATDADATTSSLVSVYFDTGRHALRRRGLSLRVRHDGASRIQTLKAEGGAGAGLFDRPEWSSEVAGESPEPSRFEDPRAVRALAARKGLAPVFETRVERTTWLVREGLSTIEIAVDEGRVSAGGATQPLAEVELELKEGRPDDLFGIARRLAATGLPRLAIRSKSDRGYALLTSGPSLATKADPVRLAPEMDAGAAFQAIARACLRHFLLNEGPLVERRAVEALHQARVAIRRLRSALSLFRDVVADGEVAAIVRELRALSALLGTARNLDVYRERVLGREAERDPAEPGLPALRTLIEAEREAAYEAVVQKLASKRFRIFMVRLAGWIEAGSWLATDAGTALRECAAWDFAELVLERRRRKVKRSGRHLRDLAPADRHHVRIHAKKLRYAGEFFASLVRGRKFRRRQADFLRALEQLQSGLGDLNDIETGHAMAEDLARRRGGGEPPGDPTLLFAAGHATGTQDSREAALLDSAVDAYEAFTKMKRFWR